MAFGSLHKSERNTLDSAKNRIRWVEGALNLEDPDSERYEEVIDQLSKASQDIWDVMEEIQGRLNDLKSG